MSTSRETPCIQEYRPFFVTVTRVPLYGTEKFRNALGLIRIDPDDVLRLVNLCSSRGHDSKRASFSSVCPLFLAETQR